MWLVAMTACGIWLGRPVIALAVETLAYALAMLWGYRSLKGLSRDVAGSALTVSECAALMALANLRL
jgi:cobalamin synthase